MKTIAEKRAYKREWYRHHKGRYREWYVKNADKKKAYQRKSDLKRNYGLTIEQWDALVALQEGRCAICKGKPQGRLVVDHDHNTGVRRGLLCHLCNAMLGMARDRPETLRAGATYLEA